MYRFELELNITTANPKKSSFKGQTGYVEVMSKTEEFDKEDPQLLLMLRDEFQPKFKQPIFHIQIVSAKLL